ncbi:sushi domain-containing protein 5 [Arapaima gigas]
MERLGTQTLLVLLLLGTFGWTGARAEGWLFLLQGHNAPVVEDGQAAQKVCEMHGARLASPEELEVSVGRCSLSSCARGWLAGPAVGTIVCNHVVGGQRGRKLAQVMVENVTAVTHQMDIFCYKDKGGAVCREPPSFPHAELRRQTGSEVGDELQYGCAAGYSLPGGQSTFSLLCDSCGEWYGQVQLCTPGDVEMHVDYEDKFPVSYDESDERPETGFSDSEGLEEDAGTPAAGGQRDTQLPPLATEASVSLLSQKHLFWFPAETLQESGQQGVAGVTGAPAWEEDNHIGPKVGGRTEDAVKMGARNNTDESWLDGYPVPEDNGKRPSAGATAEEDEDVGVADSRTDSPNHVESTSSVPSLDFTQVTASPTGPGRYGVKWVFRGATPASPPDRVGVGGGDEPQPSTQHPLLIHTGVSTSMAAPTTHSLVPFLDHIPGPTEEEEAPPGSTTTQSPGKFAGTGPYEESTEQNLTQWGPGLEALPSEEPCVGETCTSGGRRSVIAVVAVAMCALLAAAGLAAWCYRRRQQKSSVYKMTGPGSQAQQQQQHIEMQQKV